MQRGLIDAIEAIMKDQIELASEINLLATRQYSAILGKEEFAVADADKLMSATAKLEVLETERRAMLADSSIGMEDLLPLSDSLKEHLARLREVIATMRESVKKIMAILDIQILRTRALFDTVRMATGDSNEPVEYGCKGKVKRGSGGGLLGAG